jgi:formate dehydrogenase maturation protein FdhE
MQASVDAFTTQDPRLLLSLREARDQHPGLSDLIRFQERVLEEQLAVVASDLPGPPLPDGATIEQRLESGQPVLEFEDVVASPHLLQRVCDRLARVAAEYLARFDPVLADRVDWVGPAREWYLSRAGLGLHLDATRKEAERLVAGYGVVPFLEQASAKLADAVQGRTWGRGYCPVCGGAPNFSAIGEEAGRVMLCGRCGSRWDYDRVGCPFCGETRSAKLAFHPVGDGRYRLHVCYSCRGYVKCIDLRRNIDVPCLPLERILSAGLDVAAVRAGFQQV